MPTSAVAGSSEMPRGDALVSTRSERLIAVAIAIGLGLGTVASVLAVVPSPLFDLDRFAVPKELALHLTALVTGLLLLSKTDRIDVGIGEVLLLAFAGWSTASALFASNHWLAARSLGLTLSGIVVFFAARYAARHGARRIALAGIVLAVIAGGLTGVLQAHGWNSALLADSRAPGGTLGNRNFMAHLAVVGVPPLVWIAAAARRRWVAAVSAAATVVLADAVVLSRSRAAWLAIGVAGVVVAVVARLTRGATPRISRRRFLTITLAILAGVLVAVTLPNQLEWRSDSPYRDSLRDVVNYRGGSGRGRLIQYRNSLELVTHDPILGVGPGNWAVAYPLVTTPGDPSFNAADPLPTNPWPSSDWIAVLTERGPAGATLWLLGLVTFGIIGLRRARNDDPNEGAAALASVGLVTALSVAGAFDAVMLLAPPILVTLTGLGALVPTTRPVAAFAVRGRRGKWLAAFAGLIVVVTIKSYGQLEAILKAGPGYPSDRLEKALAYDPGSYRLHILLATRESCPESRRHAVRAAELFPNHAWPKRVGRCRPE